MSQTNPDILRQNIPANMTVNSHKNLYQEDETLHAQAFITFRERLIYLHEWTFKMAFLIWATVLTAVSGPPKRSCYLFKLVTELLQL